MELYLAVRGSHETQPRLFPLDRGRTWQAGRYMGPLDNGRYIRDQEGPLDAIPEYIPLEPNTCINRFHFEVGCDETGPWVRDLRSANGTSRNGVRLPYADAQAVRRAYNFSNLQSFLDVYYRACSVLIHERDFYELTAAYLARARD